MGREAKCVCRWRGEVAETKVLLESEDLILRGGIKETIKRSSIRGFAVDGDELVLGIGRASLVLELGEGDAQKWATALAKPAPTLAQKLGLTPTTRAFVIGAASDPALAGALAGAATQRLEDAAMLLAVLHEAADLNVVMSRAKKAPELPVWCIHGKGKSAVVSEGAVRGFMRDKGYTDNKSCAVSGQWSATRYARARQLW